MFINDNEPFVAHYLDELVDHIVGKKGAFRHDLLTASDIRYELMRRKRVNLDHYSKMYNAQKINWWLGKRKFEKLKMEIRGVIHIVWAMDNNIKYDLLEPEEVAKHYLKQKTPMGMKKWNTK